MQTLPVKLLNENAQLPTQAYGDSAGLDLYSAVDMEIPPRNKGKVSIGISIEIPDGHYGRIAPRSSLAWNNFIDVGAGVIDKSYRGEIQVVLFNHQEEIFRGNS